MSNVCLHTHPEPRAQKELWAALKVTTKKIALVNPNENKQKTQLE